MLAGARVPVQGIDLQHENREGHCDCTTEEENNLADVRKC